MITGIAFLLLLLSVPLFGGDLERLGRLRPRHAWTIVAAIGIQFAVITLFAARMPFALAAGLHLFSYALALMFVLANRSTPGIGVVVLGGLMNLAAIVANGGVMPASYDALERAGKITSSSEFENSTTIPDASLAFLGDNYAIPAGIPYVSNVFSIGDVVLVLGGGLLLHQACGSRLVQRRRPVATAA